MQPSLKDLQNGLQDEGRLKAHRASAMIAIDPAGNMAQTTADGQNPALPIIRNIP